MSSGAEVVFKNNCFEMHGLDTQVRAAASMVLELDIVKVHFNFFLFYPQRAYYDYIRVSNMKYASKLN